MTDDKITDLGQKQSKNPKDAAINKLKDAAARDLQQKIDAQMQKTIAAGKVFGAEKEALNKLIEDSEEDKAVLSDILKGL